ncbi:MAG: GNAT family N-acetyltransferase [Hasllibacter sp.]
MILRAQRAGEGGAVAALVLRAFAPMPFADDGDPLIPAALRASGDLVLALVGIEGGRIVGQVCFSEASVGGAAGWVALGPIAVAPERQRRGIGRALIAAGLARLADRPGCVLLGDPDVYGGSGFAAGDLSWRDVPARNVMKRVLAGPDAAGEVVFAPAFG